MLQGLVDLGRYPIDCPDSRAYDRMIEDLRRELDHDGCAVLPGFVHEAGLEHLSSSTAISARDFWRNYLRAMPSLR